MLFQRILKSVGFPVDRCPSRANNLEILRENFMYRHWKSNVDIKQEVPELLLKCDQCGMHLPADRFFSTYRQISATR